MVEKDGVFQVIFIKLNIPKFLGCFYFSFLQKSSCLIKDCNLDSLSYLNSVLKEFEIFKIKTLKPCMEVLSLNGSFMLLIKFFKVFAVFLGVSFRGANVVLNLPGVLNDGTDGINNVRGTQLESCVKLLDVRGKV